MYVDDSEVPAAVSELMRTITTEMSKDPDYCDGGGCDSDAVIDSLINFADILALRSPDIITSLEPEPICEALSLAIERADQDAIIDHATTCVASLMGISPATIHLFLGHKIIKCLRLCMPQVGSSVCSNIVNILGHIAQVDLGLIGRKFGFTVLLQNLCRCRPVEQAKGMKLIAHTASLCGADLFSSCIPDLVPFLEGNPRLKPDAVSAFCSIVSRAEDPPEEIYPAITRLISTNTDNALLVQVVRACRALAQHPLISLRLVNCEMDFEKLLLVLPFAGGQPEIGRETLLLLLEFLPFLDLPFADLYDLKRHRINRSAAIGCFRRLLPLLERFVRADVIGRDICLLVLKQALELLQQKLNPELYTVLAALCFDSAYVPSVLAVASTVCEVDDLVLSGLFHALKTASLTSDWCISRLAALESRVAAAIRPADQVRLFETLSDVLEVVEAKKMTGFAFEAAGLMDTSMRFLRDHADQRLDLSSLAQICCGLLGPAPLPEMKTLFVDCAPDAFARSTYQYNVVCNGQTFSDIAVPMFSSFVAIEAALNEKKQSGLPGLGSRCPELSPSRIESLSLNERGFLHRHFGTPGYERYAFVLSGKRYCYLDSIFHVGARSLDSQDVYKGMVHQIEAVPEDGECRYAEYELRDVDVGERLCKLLEFSDLLHAADPGLDLRCRELEDRLVPHVRDLFANVAYFSPLLRIVFGHPHLFSLKIKADLFRLVALDMYSAFAFAHSALFGKQNQLANGRSFWNCTVRRSHILEDGIRVMKDFAPGSMTIDIQFEGEVGSGLGPTHEFCGLLAKELCRKSLNLWRSTDLDDSQPYAFTDAGLFPRPGADPNMFYVLGLLCGKALAMNITLPIPLSEPFLHFCAGETVSVYDVDQQLGAILADPDALVAAELPFTYPGIEALELIPNGSRALVTRTNCTRYVEAVAAFTCGEPLAGIRDRFNAGLFAVVEPGLWNRLTARDKVLLLTGETGRLTMGVMRQHIQFAHGYSERSSQAQMLLEVIDEFNTEQQKNWLHFVTGCERLPVGGLASLVPKITVAQRAPDEPGMDPDDTFPTASVCFHYFKLPPYSSKGTMRARIIEALKEGEGFHMS
jgi:hypothetical protein